MNSVDEDESTWKRLNATSLSHKRDMRWLCQDYVKKIRRDMRHRGKDGAVFWNTVNVANMFYTVERDPARLGFHWCGHVEVGPTYYSYWNKTDHVVYRTRLVAIKPDHCVLELSSDVAEPEWFCVHFESSKRSLAEMLALTRHVFWLADLYAKRYPSKCLPPGPRRTRSGRPYGPAT